MFLSGLVHDYILFMAIGWFAPYNTITFVAMVVVKHKQEEVGQQEKEKNRRNSADEEAVSFKKYMTITSIIIGQGVSLLIFTLEYYARQNCHFKLSSHPLIDYFIPRFPFCIKLVVRNE